MIYLDNSALEQPLEDVIITVNNVLMNQWYNPNSLYTNGNNSKKIIQETKETISKEINCKPNEIIFCSCGSEANALATCGYIRKHKLDSFVTSTIEHPSIAENPYSRKIIRVDKDGNFNIDDIKKIDNSLVSIQMANSEIGTIQNIKELIEILHKNNCIVHTDAVQAFGKIKIDVKDLGVDLLTATSQKIGGILGCSFLYIRQGITLEPLIFGHNTLRGGTPNVCAIAGFGTAVKNIKYSFSVSKNRDYVLNYLLQNVPDCYLVGAKNNRLPNNLYVCFKGIEGESLMFMLDNLGIAVSTGSACNSGNLTPSTTLVAIGMDKKDIHSCIRLTFNGNETKEDLDYVNEKIKSCVNILRIMR